ncbi:transcription termination factor Rho [Dermatobacter hominis]|uniref:transcription termination factor Rho n=1 Tax=Dermatobacter hominis TaxID=2884263 RepID=UPI001D10ACA2|nr:transcription termination factor Rho [Dermatobacter hominis]UDY37226.1 transcription termination factor Rho [Dermatobacter hominis]
MSLDSIDVDGLERKDRAELATIAEALGGKPTSRTKKADIIGMILDLAGVTSGGSDPDADTSGSNGNGATADAATDGSTAPDAEAEDAAAPVDATTEAPATEADDDTDGSTAEATTSDDDDDAAEADRGKGDAQGRQGGQGRQNGQGRNPGQGGQNQGAQTQGGQNQGGQNQGGQNQGAQQGDAEPGNRRRRRRRGRDRDRQGDEAAQQPQNDNWDGEPVEVSGYLDLRDEGYGFLRVKGFLPSRDDVYVSVKQTRQLGLRKGDFLEGASRPAGRGEKNPALLRIDKVNGQDPEVARNRPRFEDLTPLFPDERLHLEREDLPGDMTSRIVDLIAPIGKGQRGLIVSPPKAGKTTVMKTIAQSIEHNNPEVHLMVLLVDERPEEVTDMRRSVRGDVIASTFDRPSDEHTQVAELASERAKRMVEDGKDVVIILDGITRLARAYNLAAPATGRIMSGGIDTGALYPPKKFFGAARNVEEGGSLTILATALVETGSKMDEVIFEEFKGTGNMELRLDRRAAEKRIYPAIDVDASSTRHEELLFERTQLQQVWKLRRVLSGLAAEGNTGAGLELLIDRMRTFPSNGVFLAEIAKAPGVPG